MNAAEFVVGKWNRVGLSERSAARQHFPDLCDLVGHAKPARRTLTNLYDERLQWLVNARAQLAAAVFTAYGWPPNLTDDQILECLLKLSMEGAEA